MPEKDFDVYICYSNKDKTIADALVAHLERQMIRCWIAPRDIPAGHPYAQSIGDAVSRAKIFVLIVSAQSIQSQFVLCETRLAGDKEKFIIPFCLDSTPWTGCFREYRLIDSQWIDASSQTETHFPEVAEIIRKHLGRTSEPPPKGITCFTKLAEILKPRVRKPEPTPKVIKSQSAFDVFISYSTKDKTIADALVAYLEQQGIRCWIAPRDIPPGQPAYAQAIVDAISQTKIFVLIFSAQSNQSLDVLQETDLAKNNKKVIIPFRIDNTSLEGSAFSYYLTIRQWIVAADAPETHFPEVAEAVRRQIGNSRAPAGQVGTWSRKAAPKKRETPISYRRAPQPKVGPNDPCPCGSGRKYKSCCGK